MLKLVGWLSVAVGFLWTLFSVLATVSSDDALKNVQSWLPTDWLKGLFEKVGYVATSPIVQIITFVIVGFLIGFWTRGRFRKTAATTEDIFPWWIATSVELSNIAKSINSISSFSDTNQLNARIVSVRYGEPT